MNYYQNYGGGGGGGGWGTKQVRIPESSYSLGVECVYVYSSNSQPRWHPIFSRNLLVSTRI